MITGFNTDIKHGGVTYHVQTEDKGLDSPLILSLVYVGGAIIAAKRTPYEDLLGKGFDEKVLTERLQRQHKLICAAIKSGRVEDLKRMGAQNGGAAKPEGEPPDADAAPEVPKPEGAKHGGRKKKAEPSEPVRTAPPAEPAPQVETAPPVEQASLVKTAPTAEASPVEEAPSAVTTKPAGEPPPAARVETPQAPKPAPPVKPKAEAPRPAPAPQRAPKTEPEIVLLTTLADEVSALGDFLYRPEPKPAEPAPPVSAEPITEAEPIPVTPILEAEILEEPEEASDELYLSLLEDEGDFRAGQLATVKVYVGRGQYGRMPVAEASVTVKVLGTSFRPIILTATTDDDGVAVVRVLLPRFTAGRAAIIIRSTAGDDMAEMRRIIRQ